MKKNDFQQIKSSVRIEEVIGGYQHLEPKGRIMSAVSVSSGPPSVVDGESRKTNLFLFCLRGTWGCIRVCQEDGTLYVE